MKKLRKIVSEGVESIKSFYNVYLPKVPPASRLDEVYSKVVFTSDDLAKQKEKIASYDFSL